MSVGNDAYKDPYHCQCLPVCFSMFQSQKMKIYSQNMPKLYTVDKAQIGDGNEEGDKEAAIGADDNISVQS